MLVAGKYIVDANTLVTAAVRWFEAGGKWARVPPDRSPADYCALSIADDTRDDWALWLSPKLLDFTRRVLTGTLGQQFRAKPFPDDQVDGYIEELKMIVDWSRGDIAEPQGRVVGLFGDSEDDKNVGSLVITVGAQVVVSADGDVQSVRQRVLPRLGGKDQLVLFLGPQAFVDHVSATRAAAD